MGPWPSAMMLSWPETGTQFLKPLITSALPSCRPVVMSAVLASLPASDSGIARAVGPP